ncbi:unnamed protein product [Rotaria magnacalcarata]
MYVAERFFDAGQEYLPKSSAFERYANESLVTIEMAIRVLEPPIYNCDVMALTAKRIMSCSVGVLTIDEAAAIYLYTMWSGKPEQAISTQLNRTLRSGTQDELTSWLSYLQLFVTALNKLPSVNGTIWRFARGDITSYYRNYCVWSGFSSCTRIESLFEAFLNRNYVYTIFEIECISGKAIRKYSECPNEDEVLLMPGTRLRVIKKENLSNGFKKVYLQEEGHPNQQLAPRLGTSVSFNGTYRTGQDFHSTLNQSNNEIKSRPLYTARTTLSIQPIHENQTHQSRRFSIDQNRFNNDHIKRTFSLSEYERVEKLNDHYVSHKFWLDCLYHDYSKRLIMTPQDLEIKLRYPPTTVHYITLNRVKGSMFGMTLGDAVGTHIKFLPRQYLKEIPVRDLHEGRTWCLKKGQFTDDTSMALCLAASLVCRRDFVPYDQLVRYKWWYRNGYMSLNGKCFDIGASTSQSLCEFERRQRLFANKYQIPLDEIDSLSDHYLLEKFDVFCSANGAVGNGALMRLAPVPLFFYRDPIQAVEFSGISGIITHDDQRVYDACRYYGALIVAALRGEAKSQLLDNDFYWKHIQWFNNKPLTLEVINIAHGSYKKPGGHRDGIRGNGYIINALEAALWAFYYDENSFEKGLLDVVNLGDETNTTAAIYGQLAGAYYGYDCVPDKWKKQMYASNFLQCLCEWIVYEGELWKSKSSISNESEANDQFHSNFLSQSNIEWRSMSDTCLAHAEASTVARKEQPFNKLGLASSVHFSDLPSRTNHGANRVVRSTLSWKPRTTQTRYEYGVRVGSSVGGGLCYKDYNEKPFKYSVTTGIRYSPVTKSYYDFNGLKQEAQFSTYEQLPNVTHWPWNRGQPVAPYSTQYYVSLSDVP